ncbi:MAG: hypothetical protein A3H32_14475 [Betaproteobacteria bacterium RIFCSPLOWO2_02_FULL_63_19]|nr:MAG: hypothetical protein A3H32_14475 [Betaproteobacteria bacterium RIFCSPLOWO2_02_FULL_63_19]
MTICRIELTVFQFALTKRTQSVCFSGIQCFRSAIKCALVFNVAGIKINQPRVSLYLPTQISGCEFCQNRFPALQARLCKQWFDGIFRDDDMLRCQSFCFIKLILNN